MNPAMGPKQGKVWGDTQLDFAWNSIEAHAINVMKGGYCSKHVHHTKWNRFHVLRGSLRVCLYQSDGQVDETIVGPSEITDVPPGVRHMFQALEDTIAVEFYWTELSVDDIDRGGTHGGVALDASHFSTEEETTNIAEDMHGILRVLEEHELRPDKTIHGQDSVERDTCKKVTYNWYVESEKANIWLDVNEAGKCKIRKATWNPWIKTWDHQLLYQKVGVDHAEIIEYLEWALGKRGKPNVQ